MFRGKKLLDENKLWSMRRKYKYTCTYCGWDNIIYPFEKTEKKVCKNCGHYVYTTKKAEFKDKMKGMIK